jgi:hypothetical protein
MTAPKLAETSRIPRHSIHADSRLWPTSRHRDAKAADKNISPIPAGRDGDLQWRLDGGGRARVLIAEAGTLPLGRPGDLAGSSAVGQPPDGGTKARCAGTGEPS